MTDNVFERFGITHLSPSHINMRMTKPLQWGRKYLRRQDPYVNAAMLRGRAVEAGWADWLGHGDLALATEHMNVTFTAELEAAGIVDESNERRNLAPMLGQAIDWGAPFGAAKEMQVRVEHWFPDVPVPVIGYVDVGFEQGDVDLKSSTRLPNGGRATQAHICQVALYRAARDMRPHTLLYVTGMKFLAVPVTDEETAWGLDVLHEEALSIQEFLQRMPDAETAVRCLGGAYIPFPNKPDLMLGVEDLV